MRAFAIQLTKVLNDYKIPADKQTIAAGMLLAQHIAAKQDLPSMAVESPHAYYTEHCEKDTRQLVYQFNDHRMIPIDSTIALVRKMWVARYRLCHSAIGVGLLGMAECLDTGINACFTQEQKDLLNNSDLSKVARVI